MWLINLAMRRPITILVAVVGTQLERPACARHVYRGGMA
jgi:hypothetical protein